MLMLVEALKIAISRVSISIVNIFLFRNVFSLFKMFMGGFYAFVLTVYVSGKIRKKLRERYGKVREKQARERGTKMFKFDATSLQSIDLDQDVQSLERLRDYVKRHSESDLFTCMFLASAESTLISLLTILAVEHLNTRYELSLILSILFSVAVSFLLCFGSSFKYTQMLVSEWLDDFESQVVAAVLGNSNKSGEGHSRLRKILVTHTNPIDGSVEYVGLWLSKYDSHRNASKVELRFLAPNYVEHIQQVFNYYAKHHMKLEKSRDTNTNGDELLPPPPQPRQGSAGGEQHQKSNTKVEKYELFVSDYYNGGGFAKLYEKEAKDLGFTCQDSWTEFRLFPGVNFNINVYMNTGKPKKTLKTN